MSWAILHSRGRLCHKSFLGNRKIGMWYTVCIGPPCDPSLDSFLPCPALWFCCVWTIPVPAAEKSSSYRAALESIKAADLGGHVGTLAGEEMEGREAGTPGGLAAGEYLAKQYARLHLPAGDDGTFLSALRPQLPQRVGDRRRERSQAAAAGDRGLCPLRPPWLRRSFQPRSLRIHPSRRRRQRQRHRGRVGSGPGLGLLAGPPKRSILLANWDAEEKGLLGSKHWVAHPTIPLERVVAAINLDMTPAGSAMSG